MCVSQSIVIQCVRVSQYILIAIENDEKKAENKNSEYKIKLVNEERMTRAAMTELTTTTKAARK